MYEAKITERIIGESFTIVLDKDWMGPSDFDYALIEGEPKPVKGGFTYTMRILSFEEATRMLKENPNAPIIKISSFE